MQIVNYVLIYSESEIPKGKSLDDIQDKIPKSKYYDVRKIEDIAHKTWTNKKSPDAKMEFKKLITPAGLVNRADRRYRKKYNLRLNGHKLDYHHKQIKKRRLRKKNAV